jgi:TRAP-type C4-dicarboxylate transport system permease large subunit
VLPFVLAEFAVLALIAFFPEIVTAFSGEYSAIKRNRK